LIISAIMSMAFEAGPNITQTMLLAAALGVLLQSACAFAEEIDTEHIYGFIIGTDVGDPGEREFQTTATGRFSKQAGNYQALDQELEMEFVPFRNFRVEFGTTLAAYDISSVPGLASLNQAGWQGAALDLRYKFLDRQTAPFGLTLAVETHGNRFDEISGLQARSYGTELTLALEKDLIPNLAVATLNLGYQPEWTHLASTPIEQQDSAFTAAFGVMAQISPGLLLGGEARYFRQFEGIGPDDFAGEAFFVGPTAYFQLTERARITASWSFQAWGRPAASGVTLDLVNFERQQARLVFGLNF
jgi:Putative MetA-pathway of phenol degradation